jgi:hypothetical protein
MTLVQSEHLPVRKLQRPNKMIDQNEIQYTRRTLNCVEWFGFSSLEFKGLNESVAESV